MSDPTGLHAITVGASLRRQTTRTSNHPTYHAFKYNFQPGTIDHSHPSSLSGGSQDGSGEYTLLTPSRDREGTNAPGVGTLQQHVFKGVQVPQKEVDCLLIYDETSDSYRLERLESVLRLDHQRQGQVQGQVQGHSRTTSNSSAISVLPLLGEQNTVSETADAKVDEVAQRRIKSSPLKASSTRTQHEARITSPSPAPSLVEDKPAATSPPRSNKDKEHKEQSIVTVAADAVEEEEDDEDEDLDDLANMLELTLDQSASEPPATTSSTIKQGSDGQETIEIREDESSEDED